MKKLNTLYSILLQEYEADTVSNFLCCAIDDVCLKRGLITIKERQALLAHFEKQKPSKDKHFEFYNVSYWCGVGAWWYLYQDIERGRQIRKDFVNLYK